MMIIWVNSNRIQIKKKKKHKEGQGRWVQDEKAKPVKNKIMIFNNFNKYKMKTKVVVHKQILLNKRVTKREERQRMQ